MNQPSPPKTSPCRFLKAKNSFGMVESGEHWHGIEDPSASYWCVKSSGPVGPDNGMVGPKQCITGRKCFISPDH